MWNCSELILPDASAELRLCSYLAKMMNDASSLGIPKKTIHTYIRDIYIYTDRQTAKERPAQVDA